MTPREEVVAALTRPQRIALGVQGTTLDGVDQAGRPVMRRPRKFSTAAADDVFAVDRHGCDRTPALPIIRLDD